MDHSIRGHIAELYALPPGDFTRTRDARAAALKAAGRHADAQAVRRLRRPPVTLWATNQLARADSERLADFIANVDRVRRTQLRDLRGAGDALQRQRAALDALVGRAGELLAGQGHRAAPAMQRRIADTLLGAAVDRRRSRELQEGRLTEELPAPGFEVLTGAPGGGRHLRLVQGGRPGRVKESSTREEELRAQAEQDRQRRRREAEALEREAATRATEARRQLEEQTRKTTAARERLREAQRTAREAATAGRKARRAVSAAAEGGPRRQPARSTTRNPS
jgi:hypothetical protein